MGEMRETIANRRIFASYSKQTVMTALADVAESHRNERLSPIVSCLFNTSRPSLQVRVVRCGELAFAVSMHEFHQRVALSRVVGIARAFAI